MLAWQHSRLVSGDLFWRCVGGCISVCISVLVIRGMKHSSVICPLDEFIKNEKRQRSPSCRQTPASPILSHLET